MAQHRPIDHLPTDEAPSDDSRSSEDEPVERRVSAQWLAAMLIDISAHLVNAIDKASRIRDPLERIAEAAESAAPSPERRSQRWPAMATMAILVVVAAVGGFEAARYRLSIRSRHPAAVSSVTAAQGARSGIEFRLGGVIYKATKSAIEDRLRNAQPEAVRKYYVDIDGRRFPVKQAVSLGLGAPRSAFRSDQALRVLEELGFQTGQRQP